MSGDNPNANIGGPIPTITEMIAKEEALIHKGLTDGADVTLSLGLVRLYRQIEQDRTERVRLEKQPATSLAGYESKAEQEYRKFLQDERKRSLREMGDGKDEEKAKHEEEEWDHCQEPGAIYSARNGDGGWWRWIKKKSGVY
jgi:hypothetical protein